MFLCFSACFVSGVCDIIGCGGFGHSMDNENKQVPTAVEASGAIQPGDTILSVNGIPMPGAGCYRRDAALLEAPGMFPMRLRIRRGGSGDADAFNGLEENGGEFGVVEGGGGGRGALEGSLSRLKQVRLIFVALL